MRSHFSVRFPGELRVEFARMNINNNVIEAIGNTPLIKLKRASELTGCTILGKAEFMNPGQSVKDRAGKWMILEAEKRGELRPGGLVVEATAGNTGIGLAVVASARGYRTLKTVTTNSAGYWTLHSSTKGVDWRVRWISPAGVKYEGPPIRAY